MNNFEFTPLFQFDNKSTSDDLDSMKKTFVKVIGSNVFVGKKLGEDKDFFWHFSQRGVNSTFTCNRAVVFNNPMKEVRLDHDFVNAPPYFGDIDTDWVGPYMCKLQSESTNYTFVGGHHDKTGGTNPAGTPSSRSSGFELFIDGALKNFDGEYVCKKVKLKTTNFVQSNNPESNQEILKQEVTFSVNENGIHAEIDTIALEDIRVDRFYGIQCYALAGFSEVRFLGDDTASGMLLPNQAGTSDSGKLVREVAHHLNDGNILTSFLENSSAGDFRFKGNNPCASRTNYKTYFNSIYANINLAKNEAIKISGGYSITELSKKKGGAKGISLIPQRDGFKVISDFYGALDVSSLELKGNFNESSLIYQDGSNNCNVPQFLVDDIRVEKDGVENNAISNAFYKNI